jgi:5-methylcytosine-specific restriction endonuclease McrA
MKICCICNLEKELFNFCKNKNSKDKLSVQCKECAKNYQQNNKRKYNSSNKEYRKSYRLENKIRINFLRSKNRKLNSNIINEKAKANYLINKIKIREYQRKFYQNNKAYFSLKNKNYRMNNIEYILLKNRVRKVLLKNFPTIKQVKINELLINNNHKCLYCGIKVERKINLHLDHKIPLSKNGSHTIENIAISCASCNLRKGTKSMKEFLQILGANS